MKLDILAFAAHPDDVELSCSGTLIKHIKSGYKAGIVDLTAGELGTRGSAELREKEAALASEILGVSARENLNLKDGLFGIDEASRLSVVRMVRKYRPEIVFANSVRDRHPDHGRASSLVSESCFLAGLTKLVTELNGEIQQAWRPKAIYHYVQDYQLKPDLIVDISDYMEDRLKSILAYGSQFYNPDSKEPQTAISSKEFLEILRSRALENGRLIGALYGEAFIVERPPGVDDLMKLK
jgi:bacillithiol biosynthesis deacetylase BshB1